MRAVQVRLGDGDRERYADGDEWLTFDPNIYDDMDWRELLVIEQEIGVSIWNLRTVELPGNTAHGIAATMWLARQQAGLIEPDFADFAIKPTTCRIRVAGAAVPLDGDSPTPGETDPPTSRPSAKAAASKKPSGSSRRH